MSRLPAVQRMLMAASAATALATACGTPTLAQSAASEVAEVTPQIAIQPLTHVVPNVSGYFSDPYPIHLGPAGINAGIPQSLSGTTPQILSCPGKIKAGCFKPTPLTVTGGVLEQQAQTHGSKLGVFENNNIFQDDAGNWQMATTVNIQNPAFPNAGPWTVIVHAHPTTPSAETIPTDWVADTLLIGSFAEPEKANYDGKYFEDSGKLYLLYSKRLPTTEPHDGIVAQLMVSPTQAAPEQPNVLLQPDIADGGFNSEFFNYLQPDSQFKLIETGNITVIDGKYVMAYSTGAFDQPNYKTGVAWSDTLLPPAGSNYKKVLKEDTAGVWGQPNHLEVQYLLQAQISDWPNYVFSQVLAPGVPSIVSDGNGGWLLYFAGYAPSDAPTKAPSGDFKPDHRRPLFVPLQVAIPAGATVAGTSSTDLVGWLTPLIH